MGDYIDPVMARVRAVFEASGKTLDQLGIGLGHESGVARKAAWQFLNKVGNPRIGTLRSFCRVVEIELANLFVDRQADDESSGRSGEVKVDRVAFVAAWERGDTIAKMRKDFRISNQALYNRVRWFGLKLRYQTEETA